ncbi:hypothetical protein pEaSNUABM11_00220 [Erwinia phage pEa_SNUABM_11]|nr:hypothetical protein pEaSNUABM11_00220 [Erwinia phage pEa_SNUABM_11]
MRNSHAPKMSHLRILHTNRPEQREPDEEQKGPLYLTWTPPCSSRNRFLTFHETELKRFFGWEHRRFVNVGTIGHVEWGMKPLTAAIIYNLPAVRHKLKRSSWYTHNVFG